MPAQNYTSYADAIQFTYSLTFNAIAGAASLQQPLILDGDSSFDLYAILAATDQDPAVKNTDVGAILPDNFTAMVQLQSTGRNWSSEPLRRSLLCGSTAAYALREARAIRFPPKTQFYITVLNLLPATPLTVQFAFRGYKILGNSANLPPA